MVWSQAVDRLGLFLAAIALWVAGGVTFARRRGQSSLGFLLLALSCSAWSAVLVIELGNDTATGDCTTIPHHGERPALALAVAWGMGMVALAASRDRGGRVRLLSWAGAGAIVIGSLIYVLEANPTC